MLRHNAAALAGADWSVPVVLAGNAAVRDEVAAVLRGRRAAGARGRQRAARHRPAGPGVGAGGDPRGLPRARHRRRPAVDRSAAAAVGAGGDAGRRPGGRDGAGRGCAPAPRCRASSSWTSAARPPTSTACPTPTPSRRRSGREAVGVPARRRTVEGDLGVSWSVDALRAAAAAEGLPVPGDDPLALGEAAATVALRRHLRAEAAYGPGGASARAAGLVVLSGGVFRHADPAAVDAVVARLAADAAGRAACWPAPRSSSTGATCSPPPACWPREHPAAAGAGRGLLAGRSRLRPGDDRELGAERVGDRGDPAVEEVLGAVGACRRPRSHGARPRRCRRPRTSCSRPTAAPGAPMMPPTSWPSGGAGR